MPGYLLHQGISITCPHGGSGQLTPANTKVTVGGQPVAVVSDQTTIAGCAFNVSNVPSPCVLVQWQMPATRVTVGGTPALLSSSIGLCMSAASVPQGPATVSGYQTKVTAQ
jgi:hypothetical protein